MRSWYAIRARAEGAEVSIYDEIGAYGVSAKSFLDELGALPDDGPLTLRLNSPGGSVFDAVAIYNALKRHTGPVSVWIDGIAASAASYVAMAGDEVVMPENAFLMIHDPSGLVMGTADDMRAMAEALDKIKGSLVAGYVAGVDILRGTSIDVARSELVGIIGPNGAGKSTLIKAVFGLVPVRSGTMTLDGDDIVGVHGYDLVSRGVGYVPQVRNVFGTLSVEENLRMGVYLRPDRFAARRDDVLDLFPTLRDRRGDRADALSGGQRQVLAMARALMMEPSLLLLDEPSAGLSPAMQDEVFARIAAINHAGVSVLIVEQNAHKALRICHRGYVLDNGTDAYTGTGAELLEDPKVIELYLGSLVRNR